MMNRTGVSVETRELADRLVAYEASVTNSVDDDARSTCRVCEKLRRPLSTLAGSAGFSSLMARALTLAKREAPALQAVQVKADGSLEGLEGDAVQANAVLIASLLSLLITFVGETLLMRLLHDIWPDLSGSDPNALGKESK